MDRQSNTVVRKARGALVWLFELQDKELQRLLRSVPSEELFELLTLRPTPPIEALASEVSESYSGLRPHLYLSSALKAPEVAALAASGLWSAAQTLYHAGDRADLSAWVEEDFPFRLRRESPALLKRRSKAPGAIALSQASGVEGLLAFGPLRLT